MESTEPTAGENIAVLRKARDLSQARLAREMGITVSYLSKIEVGLRPATPPIVAAAAKALRVSTARIYGQPFAAPNEQGAHLENLRGAVRRYNLPKFDVPAPDQLAASLAKLAELRTGTHYSEMLRVLPRLLGEATATAYASDGDAVAWGQVADAYGCAYAVAHPSWWRWRSGPGWPSALRRSPPRRAPTSSAPRPSGAAPYPAGGTPSPRAEGRGRPQGAPRRRPKGIPQVRAGPPHWFGGADGEPVELLCLFGRQGERALVRDVRARPRSE